MIQLRPKSKEYYRCLYRAPKKAKSVLISAKGKLVQKDLSNLIAAITNKSNPFHRFVSSEPVPKNISAIHKTTEILYTPQLERELMWQRGIFEAFSTNLQTFITQRAVVENSIIGGNYHPAERAIHTIEEACGTSLWTLEKRFLLRELTSGLSGNTTLLSEISKSDSVAPLTAWFASFLSMRAERNVSVDAYRLKVERALGRVAESTQGDSASFIRYLRLHTDPTNLEKLSDFANDLFLYETSSSIVDRYNSFVHICVRITAETEKGASWLHPLIGGLHETIADARLGQFETYVTGIASNADTTSIELMRMFDSYTVGDYDESERLAISLLHTQPSLLEPYEIYLRSRAHRQLAPDAVAVTGSMSAVLLENLHHVFTRSTMFRTAIDTLSKIALLSGDSPLAYKLSRTILEYTSPSVSTQLQRITSLQSEFLNPQLIRVLDNPSIASTYIHSLSSLFPHSDTVSFYQALHSTFTGAQSPVFPAKIPGPRRVLYEAEALSRGGNYGDAISLIKCGLKIPPLLPNFVFREKATCLLFAAELECNHFSACAEIAVTTYDTQPHLAPCLTVQHLCQRIQSFRTPSVFADLNVPILWHYYTTDLRTLFGAYDNFLNAHGFCKPTQLLLHHESFPRDKFFYFLRNVCSMKVMSRSYHFSGTEELETERLKLCQFLSESDPTRREQYVEEINQITQRAVIRQGIRQIDESKIFVDEVGIRMAGENYFREAFLRLTEYEMLSNVHVLRLPDTRQVLLLPKLGKGDGLAERLAQSGFEVEKIKLTSDPVLTQFRDLFLELRDRFIGSKEHGLNSYLSVRIRHGTLQGQIRSAFETARLISQRESPQGAYLTNPYWEEKLVGVPAAIRAQLQTYLAIFSEQVDLVTANIKGNLIQVRTEQKGTVGLFDYSYSDDELRILYNERYAGVQDFEGFMAECFRVLWERTDKNLRGIRDEIATEVKDELYNKLTNLYDSVRQLVEPGDAPELLSAIKTCQTDVQNECDRIARWFSVSQSQTVGEFRMEDIIRISVASVNNLYPLKQITPNIATRTNERFDGKFLTQFADILRTLLENAMLHSGLHPSAVNVSITTWMRDGILHLEIGNNLSVEERIKDPVAIIARKWEDPEAPGTDENVSREGGTGLRKVAKILRVDLNRINAILKAEYAAPNRLNVFLETTTSGLLS